MGELSLHNLLRALVQIVDGSRYRAGHRDTDDPADDFDQQKNDRADNKNDPN